MVKSAVFEKWVPICESFEKLSNQPFFEGEKALDKGKGFRPRATHPCQNII